MKFMRDTVMPAYSSWVDNHNPMSEFVRLCSFVTFTNKRNTNNSDARTRISVANNNQRPTTKE